MPNDNVARRVLWPQTGNVVVRAAFLYAGQGESTVLLVRSGQGYCVLLIDINLDRKNGGIDVPRMMRDLLGGDSLYALLNTHPHEDHLCGLGDLIDQVVVDRVWHSGFSPGRDPNPGYDDLRSLIADVKKRKGNDAVRILRGSRSEESLCDATMHVLAPADHVAEDIAEEDRDKRRAMIHENCIVVKIGKRPGWILFTGDADKKAFETHITPYHKDRLQSHVLSAAHHGSRSFFKDKEEDDPYLHGLHSINPKDIIVSAPTSKESKHGHPDVDAMGLYADHVGVERVHHTGAERISFIVDILDDGSVTEVKPDNGELSAKYALAEDEGGDDGATRKGPFVSPRSATGDHTPRKFG